MILDNAKELHLNGDKEKEKELDISLTHIHSIQAMSAPFFWFSQSGCRCCNIAKLLIGLNSDLMSRKMRVAVVVAGCNKLTASFVALVVVVAAVVVFEFRTNHVRVEVKLVLEWSVAKITPPLGGISN